MSDKLIWYIGLCRWSHRPNTAQQVLNQHWIWLLHWVTYRMLHPLSQNLPTYETGNGAAIGLRPQLCEISPQKFCNLVRLLGQRLVSHWPLDLSGRRYSNVFPTWPSKTFYWALVTCLHFEPGRDHCCGNCVKDIYLGSGVMLHRKKRVTCLFKPDQGPS